MEDSTNRVSKSNKKVKVNVGEPWPEVEKIKVEKKGRKHHLQIGLLVLSSLLLLSITGYAIQAGKETILGQIFDLAKALLLGLALYALGFRSPDDKNNEKES